MGENAFSETKATDYGRKHEGVARKLYEKAMKRKHKYFKVESSGLFINKNNPLLRASPDGVTSCVCVVEKAS